jgi:cysteinyl-tRNA synthetase
MHYPLVTWCPRIFFFALVFVLTVFNPGFTQPDPVMSTAHLSPLRGPGTLADRVFTWACVYHKQDLQAFRKNMAGMLVIDPDHYSRADIEKIKGGRKIVISYLSVGEAESYRSYATEDLKKSLVLKENPNWPENFRVKFWEDAWRETLLKYGRDILDKGFDGFFLDVVDAWEDFPDIPERRKQMAKVIVTLAREFRRIRPGLLMILQNSHQLFEDPEVFAEFDGITQEGLHISWQEPAPEDSWRRKKRSALAALRHRGKYVGLLEYTRRATDIRKIKQLAHNDGFVPYFSTRELATLHQIP